MLGESFISSSQIYTIFLPYTKHSFFYAKNKSASKHCIFQNVKITGITWVYEEKVSLQEPWVSIPFLWVSIPELWVSTPEPWVLTPEPWVSIPNFRYRHQNSRSRPQCKVFCISKFIVEHLKGNIYYC